MNVNLKGDYTTEQLKSYAEYLEDAIEDLPQIKEVDIRGAQDKEDIFFEYHAHTSTPFPALAWNMKDLVTLGKKFTYDNISTCREPGFSNQQNINIIIHYEITYLM